MSLKLAAGSGNRNPGFHPPKGNPWQVSADEFPGDGTPEEQLWFAVSYALLAPSTHNTQPWQFAIHGRDLDLLADYSRQLSVVDPAGRELIMSCGAALQHVQLALRYFGYSENVAEFPDPQRPDWLARVHQGTHGETDADTVLLFRSIPHRCTNRHAFREDPIPMLVLGELEMAAQSPGVWLRVLDSDADKSSLAQLVGEGDRQQWADKAFRKELANWIRPTGLATRDGLPIATQDLGGLMSHAGAFAIRTFDLGKGYAAKDEEILKHSGALAILATDRDDPVAWLNAGQSMARVLLRAQADGLSSSFLNQPTEIAELRQSLAELLGRDGFPQVVLRLGYGNPVPHTPRRYVSDVVTVHSAN